MLEAHFLYKIYFSRFVKREPRGLEKSTYWIKHEAVDSLASGKYYHGGAAVEGVACCNKVPARLQGILLTRLSICCLRETVKFDFITDS